MPSLFFKHIDGRVIIMGPWMKIISPNGFYIRRDLSGSGLRIIVCKRLLLRELEDRFVNIRATHRCHQKKRDFPKKAAIT